MPDRAALILFLRYPERGAVKTRLAKDIGEERACELYRCFLEDLNAAARGLPADRIVSAAGVRDPGASDLFDGCVHIPQRGADLGERMHNAFADAFTRGYSRAVLVGSDIPSVTTELLDRALARLAARDCVMGPAGDGGYYLIGFRRETPRRELFQGIGWSAPRVFEDTRNRIIASGLSLALVPALDDIDGLDDLRKFYHTHAGGDRAFHTLEYIRRNPGILSGQH